MRCIRFLPLFFVGVAGMKGPAARFDAKIKTAFDRYDARNNYPRGSIGVHEAYAVLRDHAAVHHPPRRTIDQLAKHCGETGQVGLAELTEIARTATKRSLLRPVLAIGIALLADALSGQISDRTWLNIDLALGNFVSIIGRIFFFGVDLPVIDSELLSQLLLTGLFLSFVLQLVYVACRIGFWLLREDDEALRGGNGKELLPPEAATIHVNPDEARVETFTAQKSADSSSALALGGAAAAIGLGLARIGGNNATGPKQVKPKTKKKRARTTPGLVLPITSGDGRGRKSPRSVKEMPSDMTRGEKALMTSLVAGGASFLLSVV